jgi:hypothetical protein
LLAHSDHHVSVHQERFDRDASTLCARTQVGAVERRVERFRAEFAQQRMEERVAPGPQQRPKATRVAQTQAGAVIQHEIEVVVETGWRVGRDHAQAARHAEVEQRRAGRRAQQQVLGPALDGCDPLSDQFPAQPADRHRPAQSGRHHSSPSSGPRTAGMA